MADRILTALVLAWCQRWRRKSEALHLRRLGQQRPASGLGGHDKALYGQRLQMGSAVSGGRGRDARRGRRLSAKDSEVVCVWSGGQPIAAMRDQRSRIHGGLVGGRTRKRPKGRRKGARRVQVC
jgi:hypothetical protein